MSDVPTPISSAGAKQPLTLLDKQVQLLTALCEIQKRQQQQIEELKAQNERIIGLLADPKSPGSTGSLKGIIAAKIEDFNMPFSSLVGFLVKIAFASIPAAIILGIFYAIFGGVLVAIFGGLFR